MNLPCYRKLIRFFLLTSLALALTGCGSRHNDRPSGLAAPESAFLEAGQAMDRNYDESASMSEKKSADLAGYTPDTPAAAEGSGIERMIIKNGTISIQVGDPAAVSDQVRAIAAANQGYVVSGSVYKSYATDKPEADIQIRVSADLFEKAIAEIEALVGNPGKDILSKQVYGDDITDEYVDQESRLKSLEAKKAKLEEIMESAKTVKDTLSVYNEIADVNEEIEISKGQIKYMEQSARLSSISVQILSIPDPIVIAGNEWNPNDTVRGAVNDFINTGQDFIDALIYFVIAALPFLLILIVPLILIFRWLIRRGKRSKKTVASSVLNDTDKPN